MGAVQGVIQDSTVQDSTVQDSVVQNSANQASAVQKGAGRETSPHTGDEAIISERLRAFLSKSKQANIEKNIDELLDLTAGFVGRFDFFVPFLPEKAFSRILISGCAIGSEHIVAQRFGFKEAYGTEVSQELVEIAKLRLSSNPSAHVDHYSGSRLPYPAERKISASHFSFLSQSNFHAICSL
jgi:hypothetical protein